MSDTIIHIPVDQATARIYLAASPDEQHKMQLLLRLRLRELTTMPPQTLRDVMDELGAQAEARGMTPEILEDLLRDE